MDTYRVRLLERQEVADRTFALWFEKPPGFEFRAGQFVDLTLIDPPETDLAGTTRSFTVASAPGDDRLRIATRLRDTAFKRSLARLPVGAEVLIEGPLGSFTLLDLRARPAYVLAGGRCVARFVTIIFRCDDRRLAQKLVHFDYMGRGY